MKSTDLVTVFVAMILALIILYFLLGHPIEHALHDEL